MTLLINFIIIAFALFLVVKLINRLYKPDPAAPAAPPADVVLLTEIRDLLKAKQ
jgi:large conductance mechanosensitive channel